jgi:hypothetical protein
MTSSLSKAQHEWMVKPGDSGTVMVPRGTSPRTVGVVSEEEYKCGKKMEMRKRRGRRDMQGRRGGEEKGRRQSGRRKRRIRKRNRIRRSGTVLTCTGRWPLV